MTLSKNIEHLRSKSAALPRLPGVYIMENTAGEVIYVGKSRSLRDRVSSYFHGDHGVKTERMAASVHDFRFIVCDTEMEALALENSLIKQHTPRYNIKLKDAKSYPYIKIDTKSSWPRIRMTRKRVPDGSMYFGPYSSTSTVYNVIGQLERTLKLPTCKLKFPEDIGKRRPCVYYQMNRCTGVCRGDVSLSEYRASIEQAATILRGGTGKLIRELTEKMETASERMEYEEAARHRDTIMSLKKLGERQKAVGSPETECDVIGLHLTEEDAKVRDSITVFYIRDGYIGDSEHFLFGQDEILDDMSHEDDSPMTAFLISLYQSREYIPSEVLLSFELPDYECALLSDYLSGRAEHKVTVRTPKKGASKYLCHMAVTDAATHSENNRQLDKNSERTLVSLASLLQLEVVPERIEAYDISNLGEEHITCGMVACIDGKMKKSQYRTFSIKSTAGQDDYGAMAEAVSRRLSHIGEEGDSMSAYPDLILVDGGVGHVNTVTRVVSDAGYDIPIFGMVKDEHHKTRTLVNGVDEINIARHADVFRLIYGIQEEVHRYSVSRMMGAKRKGLRTSSLTKIHGIGEKKADALLRHFKSLSAIREATVEELSRVSGISATDGARIYAYFRKNKATDNEVTK